MSRIDHSFIMFCRRIAEPFARFALFLVFFWFGALKVIGASPASPLVEALFNRTIATVGFDQFIIAFGLFECLIGILFLIPKAERVVIPLLAVHLVTTLGPLVMLPEVTWTGWFVPTLEGQYIIKNVLIVAAAIVTAAHVHPLKK